MNQPPNDFDIFTVNDGMDDIDIMIDQLENNVPEELYETDEIDVDQMMKVNRGLRDKIKDIGDLVISAITKASMLKKKIVTHRDEPTNKELKDRNKQIRDYQAKLSTYKKKVKGLNIKFTNLTDNETVANNQNKVKILNNELKELKSHRLVLSKQLKNQQQVMNKLYDDPDFRDKMTQTQNDIKKLKESYTSQDQVHKSISAKQDKILKELATLNASKRKLRERKICIENNLKDKILPSKLTQFNEEASMIMRKNQLIEKHKANNQVKSKIKMHNKEKKYDEVEAEIEEIKQMLRVKNQENERLSKQVKNLKKMLPKVEKSYKDVKGSASELKLNELNKSELNNISQSIDNNDLVLGNDNDEPDRHQDKDKDNETQEDDSQDEMDETEIRNDKSEQMEFVDEETDNR